MRDVLGAERVHGSWHKLIIAGSGMATGGRVLHQLRAYAPDPRMPITPRFSTGFVTSSARRG